MQEEHKILAAEIEARKWAIGIQPRLKSKTLKPEEIVSIINEASRLKQQLPITPRHQKSWKIPQEEEAQRILSLVQGWLTKYRKCLVNPNAAPLSDRVKEGGGKASSSSSPPAPQLKRTVTIKTLKQLVEDAKDVPADLSDCVVMLESAILASKGWYDTWQGLLDRCNVEASEDDAMDVADTEHTGPKLDMHEIMQCISAAEAVGAELPEVDSLKAIVHRVNAWIEQVGNACPQRLSKRKSRAKATLAQVRELLEEGKHFPVDVVEEASKIQARLDATAEWQVQCQADLLQLGQEAENHFERFEAALEAKRKLEAETGEDQESDEIDELGAVEEVRLKRVEGIREKAGDVVIKTPEEAMVNRHLKAHKWFNAVSDVLCYSVNEVSEDQIAELMDVIEDGKRLLGLSQTKKCRESDVVSGDDRSTAPDDDASASRMDTEDSISRDGAKSEGEGPEEEEQQEGEEASTLPCDVTLNAVIQKWWDKLSELRRIFDASSEWRAKANKAMGSEKVKSR